MPEQCGTWSKRLGAVTGPRRMGSKRNSKRRSRAMRASGMGGAVWQARLRSNRVAAGRTVHVLNAFAIEAH